MNYHQFYIDVASPPITPKKSPQHVANTTQNQNREASSGAGQKMRKSTVDEITAKRGWARGERSGARLRAWGGVLLGLRFRAHKHPTTRGRFRAPASVGEGRWLVHAYYSAMRFRLLAGLLLGLRFCACACNGWWSFFVTSQNWCKIPLDIFFFL